MNLYTMVATSIGSAEAAELGARLADWHDAMVAHERRAREDEASLSCHEECPHAEAPGLWQEALAVFGRGADEFRFLRKHAARAARPESVLGATLGQARRALEA